MNEKLFIDYEINSHSVVLKTTPENYDNSWYQQLHRLLNDVSEDVSSSIQGTILAPWWAFLSCKENIGSLLKSYNINYDLSALAKEQILKSQQRNKNLTSGSMTSDISALEIQQKLVSIGWDWNGRPLTKNQLRNVQKLYKYFCGATFSVPGAGKTTEALAYFFLKAKPDQKLLVVCPKNAFVSWDEQISMCLGLAKSPFLRLRDGYENVRSILQTPSSRFLVITYQQFSRVTDLIGKFLLEHEAFLFLDESHRIKSGRGKTTADAILRIAHLPVGKLLMSGTPMPQSQDDLVSQFEFLYPEKRVTGANVIAMIKPVFVRTTKKELELPPVKRSFVEIPLSQMQQKLYLLMKSEIARQAESTLNMATRAAFRSLGKSVMRLLEVVSNPSLLLKDIGFLHQDILTEVLSEGTAPKLMYACERARQLAKRNQKCIIWTTFRENVETLANRLVDLEAVYIHGGVDAGEDSNEDTREGKIKKFKEDKNCFVLVANPAAAAESISLHKVCHHAIYVDRTYNAAHYLQSEDRIHRLGLLPNETTYIEVLVCPDTIDENVDSRIKAKVSKMATALDDDSLNVETIPYDIGDEPEDDAFSMDMDDIRSLLEWLRSKP